MRGGVGRSWVLVGTVVADGNVTEGVREKG